MIFVDLQPGLKIHHDLLGEFSVTQVVNDVVEHGITKKKGVVTYPIYYSEKHDIYFHGFSRPKQLNEKFGEYREIPADKFIDRLNRLKLDTEEFSAIKAKANKKEFIPVIDSDFKLKWLHHGINLFSGKAGVGKSYLIKSFSSNTRLTTVKLAPTAIAALNIGGSTIHSFFKLPPKLIDIENDDFITKEKKYSAFNFLIIDEISMVPGYLIDAIDKILRANNDPNKLFGGKIILAFGDLLQLEPIQERDPDALKFIQENYKGSYWFFDSKVLEDNPPYSSLVLKLFPVIIAHSKRHTDESFMKFLDIIRKGNIDASDLEFFNNTCKIINENPSQENTTWLVTRNDTAYAINNSKLEKIRGKSVDYEFNISGDWTEKFPNDESISLKVGAEIIFIKSDSDKQFINGEKGTIRKLGHHEVIVEKHNGGKITVRYLTWEKLRYIYNPDTKKLETEVIGTFSQLPLKLGWAITIHKSQGMTLDHISLNFKDPFFAKGMVYVAISRVRKLSDIYVSSGEISANVLQKPDQRVINFMDWIGIVNA